MQKVLQILLLSHCLIGLSKSEDNDEANQPGREKRHISMLRLGRSIHLPPLVPPYILDEDEDREDRQVGTFGNLPRLGTKDLDSYRSERAPPLPRMGQYEKFLAEYRRYLDDDEDQDVRQIYLSIPRTGRFARDTDSVEKLKEDNERAVPLPRYGYRDVGEEDDSERALPLPRYGYRDVGEVSERYLPRYGQREIEETRALPRYGLRESENIDEDQLDEGERAVPLPRIGYRDVDKRKMSMLRMGRSEAENKRAMSMLRLGKRKMSMLRMGRSQDTTEEESKRAMSMLRLGKRAMSMLRLGRSGTTTEEEKRGRMSMLRMGKRKMSMLRMGKRDSENNQEKRGRMSMLRMGRSSGTDEEQEVEKRPMSMLRMGKRKMSMLRMGKRDIGEDPAAEVEKRAVSMLRMGKKDDTSNAAN